MRGSAVFRTGVAPGGALAPRWTQNVLWRSAKAVPSLDLRFAESKSLTDAASGQSLVTFTRASSGTFVGSNGVLQTATNDVPRFDHNPTTGESLGLLVEEQRTNLLLQSENFGTTWTSSGLLAFGSGSTLNAASAPDGQTTADLITEDTTTATHVSTQGNISFTSGTIYTVSCFVKRGTGSRNAAIALRAAAFSGAPRVNIDLSTGATTLTGSGGTVGSLSYLNGWWRVSLTATATATVTSFVDIGLVSGAATLSYTGDGTSEIYVWGAQLEAGAFPTSYIPTTTATATRSADVASISGSNFSSWYRQDEGSVYWEGTRNRTTGFPERFSLNDGTVNNRIFSYFDAAANSSTFTVVTSSVNQGDIFGGGGALNSNLRTGFGFALNNVSAIYSGGVQNTDTTVTLPIVDRLVIGNGLGGTIRRLTYWPARLANSTLQAITQ